MRSNILVFLEKQNNLCQRVLPGVEKSQSLLKLILIVTCVDNIHVLYPNVSWKIIFSLNMYFECTFIMHFKCCFKILPMMSCRPLLLVALRLFFPKCAVQRFVVHFHQKGFPFYMMSSYSFEYFRCCQINYSQSSFLRRFW